MPFVRLSGFERSITRALAGNTSTTLPIRIPASTITGIPLCIPSNDPSLIESQLPRPDTSRPMTSAGLRENRSLGTSPHARRNSSFSLLTSENLAFRAKSSRRAFSKRSFSLFNSPIEAKKRNVSAISNAATEKIFCSGNATVMRDERIGAISPGGPNATTAHSMPKATRARKSFV